MADDTNTPFPIPILAEENGYVHQHPKTGRKYQLNNVQVGREEAHVWSAVSDVKNRTWVSADDPLARHNDFGSLNEPIAGDTWWDTHYLELRVLHHPIIGKDGNGNLIYGKKNWISSTHPMANMLGEGGSDKNQMIGPVILRIDDPFILEGERVRVKMSMPYYTGLDNFYPDSGDDPISYDKKRFTVQWSVTPEYNVDVDSFTGTPAQLEEYRNIITPEDYPSEAKLDAGKFPSVDDEFFTPVQFMSVKCTVTVKEEYNDKFIITGVDADNKPIPHESFGNRMIQVSAREEREIIIPSTIAFQTLENFCKLEKDLDHTLLPTDEDKAHPVKYLYIENKEYIVNDVDDGSGDPPGDFVLIEKQNNWGYQSWIPESLGNSKLNKQIPHITMAWDPSKFAITRLIFDFGPTTPSITAEERLDAITSGVELNLFDFDSVTYDPQSWIKDYKLRFFTDGFKPSANVDTIPDENDLYKNEINIEYYKAIDNYKINGEGEDHSVIIIELYYSTEVIPSDGLYFAMFDENDEVIPGTHGHIYRKGNVRELQEAE